MNLSTRIKSRIEAAQGRRESDLLLRNASVLDVFNCRWLDADLALLDGMIVAVEPDLRGFRARRTVDCAGQSVVPGFIDAHVHIESSMMIPSHFQDAVLAKGTTTAICDPHELANVLGLEGIQYFLDSAARLQMDLWVMLSSCVPATLMETNGGGNLRASDLAKLAPHPRALGLAEMMNMPGVLGGDEDVLAKLALFADRPVDGHCPLLRGKELSAYAAAGITSCHESSELEEAREKLTKGISVWIREGSVAKDLDALAPLLTLATSTSIGFCTDDRNPLDIALEGHIDHLVRGAIRAGVPPEVAYRSASWSTARHYGLTSGPNRIGAVAPGYGADLVLLNDRATCSIGSVYKRGQPTGEIEAPVLPFSLANSVRAALPQPVELEGPEGQVHVIGVRHGKIITSHEVLPHDAPGVTKLSVLERYGRGSKPANAYVTGFGRLRGAIASSVGHDSHNLIVTGHRTDDMRAALAALIEVGGGFCVVQDGKLLGRIALPVGGLMSARSPDELKAQLIELKAASRGIGCELPEPFLQLAFLSLPVIPSLKLTDQGLVDVEQFKIIDVRAS